MEGKVYRHRAAVCAALLAITVAGCKKESSEPEVTRPDWSKASIDGLAPLMTPEQVRVALDKYGYRQIPCRIDGPMDPHALDAGEEMSCFRSPSRPMQVALHFGDLREGRRLQNVFFSQRYDSHISDDEWRTRSRAYADELQARFGTPLVVSPGSSFTTRYWGVPGGLPSLPDTVSSISDWPEGPNVTLTSMWAGSPRGGLPEAPEDSK